MQKQLAQDVDGLLQCHGTSHDMCWDADTQTLCFTAQGGASVSVCVEGRYPGPCCVFRSDCSDPLTLTGSLPQLLPQLLTGTPPLLRQTTTQSSYSECSLEDGAAEGLCEP